MDSLRKLGIGCISIGLAAGGASFITNQAFANKLSVKALNRNVYIGFGGLGLAALGAGILIFTRKK